MTFTVWHIVVTAAVVALVVAVVVALRTRRKDIKKVAYMMDALEDGELNFRFKESNRFNRTLNRIRTIFEKQRQQHEQDSWTKLIRVLTHEIMNTVAPISSLSDALAKSVDEHGHSDLDVKAGLETISDSSKNLIEFVQTYRELSGVAGKWYALLSLREMRTLGSGMRRNASSVSWADGGMGCPSLAIRTITASSRSIRALSRMCFAPACSAFLIRLIRIWEIWPSSA